MSDLTILVLLKIAYLATGLTLCLIGKRLIDKKRETKFQGAGSVAKATSFKLMTTSPGLVFLAAGFGVIAVAAFQKTVIRESEPAGKPQAPSATAIGPARAAEAGPKPIEPLVARVREITFAAGDDNRVDSDLKRAKALVAAGKVDEAAVHLAAAVVIRPAALKEIAADPAYGAVLQHPEFNAIAHARFRLPLDTSDRPAVLSSSAEAMLAKLRTLAGRRAGGAAADEAARTDAKLIPARAGAEPQANTARTLIAVLDRSPTVLLAELSNVSRRWILDDPDIVRPLASRVDWKVRNE